MIEAVTSSGQVNPNGSAVLGKRPASPTRSEKPKSQKTNNHTEIFLTDEGYDADISDEEYPVTSNEEYPVTSKDILIGAWHLYLLRNFSPELN